MHEQDVTHIHILDWSLSLPPPPPPSYSNLLPPLSLPLVLSLSPPQSFPCLLISVSLSVSLLPDWAESIKSLSSSSRSPMGFKPRCAHAAARLEVPYSTFSKVSSMESFCSKISSKLKCGKFKLRKCREQQVESTAMTRTHTRTHTHTHTHTLHKHTHTHTYVRTNTLHGSSF